MSDNSSINNKEGWEIQDDEIKEYKSHYMRDKILKQKLKRKAIKKAIKKIDWSSRDVPINEKNRKVVKDLMSALKKT